MKRLIAVLLVLTIVFTFAACGGDSASSGSDAGDAQTSGVDMSAFPADVNEWTGQNYIDYFKAQGLFIEEGSYETWLQNHAEYFPGTHPGGGGLYSGHRPVLSLFPCPYGPQLPQGG